MKNYAEVYITALEELSKFLKTHKNLKQTEKKLSESNAWNVDNTRLPETGKSIFIKMI